MHMNHKTKVKD